MSIYTEPVGGVGFKIEADEINKLKQRFQVDADFELFGKEGKIPLPDGFSYCPFDSTDEEDGVLIIADISLALTNPALMPDWSIAKAWAKKWLINFTKAEPDLYIEQHSH